MRNGIDASQITEAAARKVCDDNGIKRLEQNESWVQALSWQLGEGMEYESTLVSLVTAALEIEKESASTRNEAIRVVGIDSDGTAIYEDTTTGERWNADEHFLTKEAQ